ncbi:polyprenyl synthetase family protein [Hansschlegelia sp. KR7-227]|uniref:polyprenyl synthetase family protein n=1 Tax=Hansschlegelia sp. KR7-227 TaxID=3400914 RepID=UPI003C002E95
MAATRSFEAHAADIAPRIEAALEAALTEAAAPGEIARPARLVAAMRHVMLGGGKRLRPALLTAAARLFGAEGEGVVRAALAVECVHGYSLAHDDLPAMDDDDLRRGRPTAHRAFDEATAILAGDALQTLAFALLADPATHPDAGVRVALVATLAAAAGVGGMAGGQMIDLAAEGRFDGGVPRRLAESEILRLQAMKTGALIEASAAMGALISGATDQEIAAVRIYGRAVGAAFQVADDLLDAEGDAADVGKATGKDEAAGKATLVGVLGASAARARLDALTQDALAALDGFGAAAEPLRGAARFVASRRS